jgi:RNA polymerase sigma-70 factor (ECF subfamily)
LRREVPWQELPDERLEMAAGEALPDEALAEKERQGRVRAALATLPPEQQEVVMLSYMEGLSHGEIAARLRLPVGTVKSRIRIAYQKIRAGLEDLR